MFYRPPARSTACHSLVDLRVRPELQEEVRGLALDVPPERGPPRGHVPRAHAGGHVVAGPEGRVRLGVVAQHDLI